MREAWICLNVMGSGRKIHREEVSLATNKLREQQESKE